MNPISPFCSANPTRKAHVKLVCPRPAITDSTPGVIEGKSGTPRKDINVEARANSHSMAPSGTMPEHFAFSQFSGGIRRETGRKVA